MCFYYIDLNYVFYFFRFVIFIELNRRRYLFFISSFDFDYMDFFVYFKELSMLRYLFEFIVIYLIFFYGVIIKVFVLIIC